METADHILIPLLDGSFGLAQVARIEDGHVLLYVARTRSAPTAKAKALIDKQIIAAFCVTLGAAKSLEWPVIGYDAVPRLAYFVDRPLTMIDPTEPAIIEAFVNAVHGLYPWDGFPEPDFFTNMLREPDALPTLARVTAEFPKPDA